MTTALPPVVDRLSVSAIYALLFTGAALAVLALGWLLDPVPRIHDEHAHLLAGHTFARGQLANESHAYADHFAAINVLSEPVYASKFPPGQGLVIALGLLAFDYAHAGIALSAGAFMCALFFMLTRLHSRRWALWGCALAGVQMVLFGYWGTTFWGGYVAATGGALVAGVCLDAWRNARIDIKFTIVLMIGLWLLSVSRPMYGVVMATPFIVLWLVQLWRSRRRSSVVGPILVFMIGGVGILGFQATYNYAITGQPHVFPHSLYQATYGHPAIFMWSQQGAPKNEGKNEKFYFVHDAFEPESVVEARTNPMQHVGLKGLVHWLFFVGPFCSILLLGLRGVARVARYRFVLGVTGMILVFDLITPWLMPHYIAPVAALVVCLLTACAGVLYSRFARVPALRIAIAGFPLILLALYCVLQGWQLRSTPKELWLDRWIFFQEIDTQPNRDRQRIAAHLAADGREHIVLVPQQRPLPQSMRHNGWVNNMVPIDEQSVLWAWDLGADANAPFLADYPQRSVWRLTFDASGRGSIDAWEASP
ncbi:MAG: hypothetical protein AB8G16_08995 [Gammaproteobacteria bacterium]